MSDNSSCPSPDPPPIGDSGDGLRVALVHDRKQTDQLKSDEPPSSSRSAPPTPPIPPTPPRGRPPQLDLGIFLYANKSMVENGVSEEPPDKSTLALLGHYMLSAAYTDVLFRSALNPDTGFPDPQDIETKLQNSVDGWIGPDWHDSLYDSIGRVESKSLAEERRLLFDIYIGTLFLKSKSGYDAVREWVEPLVERGAE